MRRLLLIASAAILATTGCIPAEQPAPVPEGGTGAGDPVMYRVPVCGVSPIGYPCVDSKSRVWPSSTGWFEPVACGAEDGGPTLPCLGRDRDQDGNWLLFLEPGTRL